MERLFHRLSRLVKLYKINAPEAVLENEIGLVERQLLRVIFSGECPDGLIELVCEMTEK